MFKRAVFLLCLLCPVSVDSSTRQQLPNVIFLEPDASTVRIENIATLRTECFEWPVDPVRPRWFNLRGKIVDIDNNTVGRYFARGVVNNPDGSHVAEYALRLDGIGTIVYSLDTTPFVFPYDTNLLIAFGLMAGTEIHLAATPALKPGCVWNMNWQIRLSDSTELNPVKNQSRKPVKKA